MITLQFLAGEKNKKTKKNRSDEVSLLSSQSGEKCLEENKSKEGSRVISKKVGREKIKITPEFRKQDEQVNLSPMMSRELREKLVEVKMTKILKDGSKLKTFKNG